MSANRVQKKSQKRSSTVRRRLLVDYTDTVGFAMPIDCSRCKRLRLSDCKAADRSLSCQNCLGAGASGCNIFGEPTSVLQGILEEKRRLDQEKKETLSKLLRLEAQSRALEAKAGEAFGREMALLREEEGAAEPSIASLGAGFPISGGDHPPLSFGDADSLDWLGGADWSALDPGPVDQVGPGFVGETAGVSPDSSGSQQVPTS